MFWPRVFVNCLQVSSWQSSWQRPWGRNVLINSCVLLISEFCCSYNVICTSIYSPCEAAQLCLPKLPLTVWCSVCTGHWAVDLLLCQMVCGFHYNVVQSIWLQCWDVVRQLWWAGHNDLIVWCTTLSVQNPESCWLSIPLHIQPAWTRRNAHCRRFKY